jgi:ACS family hexuronate transporter-like MFS transporter
MKVKSEAHSTRPPANDHQTPSRLVRSALDYRKSVETTSAETSPAAEGPQLSSYRWRICALLFFATTINYMDRQVLGVLAPDLQKIIGWNELQYSNIVTAFQAAYAIGLVSAGTIIDRVGTKAGYAMAISIWSLSAMAHSLVSTVFGFGAARFFLGLGEAGNFPAAIKTVAEWFPLKERSFATGIFNSGSNIGAIVAPIAVPWVTVRYGWRAAFLFTGIFSALWLVAWLTTYRPPERSQQEEVAVRIPWGRLVLHKQTWAFLIGKFLTDPIWWFYLFWLAKFLNAQYGLTLTALGPPLVAIYVMADVGSIGGGWIASQFLKRGWTLNQARKGAMLLCACAVVPVIAAPLVGKLWVAVGLIGLAGAAHQGWSANIFTLASDMFPKRAVASVVGIGGFGGAVGGMLIAKFTGFVLQFTGSYIPMFVIAGSAYLFALAIIHFLAPKLEPAVVEQA